MTSATKEEFSCCALNNFSHAYLRKSGTAVDMEYAYPMCQQGVNLHANAKPPEEALIVKMRRCLAKMF